MATNNQKPIDPKVKALQEQIEVLRDQLDNLEKKGGNIDSSDLVKLGNEGVELEYRSSLVNRLYERKGFFYSSFIKLPLRVMNAGSLYDSHRFMRDSFRGVTSPICVICNKGILMHSQNQLPLDGQVQWFCSNQTCTYRVWAKPANKDPLMSDVRSKLEVGIGELAGNRWSDLTEDQKDELIKSHLSKGRMFLWAAGFLLLLLIYDAFNKYVFAALMTLPIYILAVVLASKWFYRAWQVKTGNVFLPESKFIWWIKNADDWLSVDWVDQQKDDKQKDGKGGEDA